MTTTLSDPRQHRHVVDVDGDRITYGCGCVNEVSKPYGVLRSLSKCRHHKQAYRDPATLDGAYYAELGLLKGGQLVETAHVTELTEALGPIPSATTHPNALEIGGGVSPYVRHLMACGWAYHGIEPSRWAAEFVRDNCGVVVYDGRLEDIDATDHPGDYGLILAAHCLEHMDDAPRAIRRCARLLAPGGELWVVVPDDSDPLNPDHTFFFDVSTLRTCLEAVGLVVERMAIRKYVPRENFLYAKARKP